MNKNIKRLDKWFILIIICVIIYLVFDFTKSIWLTAEGFKKEVSQNLSNFEIELLGLKKELKTLLNQESNFSEIGKNERVNWYVLHSLQQSNNSIKAINGGDSEGKIILFYMNTSIQIAGILQDHRIDTKEKQYLEDLDTFTTEVIGIYNIYTKSINMQNDSEYYSIKSLPNKKVYNIYENFFKETDQLYMQDKYKYMRLYDEYEPNEIYK